MRKISTENAPKPAGHYSQAIEHEGIVYVSGQLPINPESDKREVGSIEEQTEQVLANLEAILIASNSSIHRVLKVTVYISDISHWDQVNSTYSRIFGDHRPARAIVPTRDLHFGYQIELDAIAIVNN
jgi:2-iminobutanoate/2-iminopropanoate deaminase